MARLLLTLFVVRALVPVGYMPDLQAAAQGVFKIVICSAMGSKTIELAADGSPVGGQQGYQQEQPCAFSGLAAVSLPELEAVALAVAAFDVTTTLPTLSVALPPARAGPAHGSRAPPELS